MFNPPQTWYLTKRPPPPKRFPIARQHAKVVVRIGAFVVVFEQANSKPRLSSWGVISFGINPVGCFSKVDPHGPSFLWDGLGFFPETVDGWPPTHSFRDYFRIPCELRPFGRSFGGSASA